MPELETQAQSVAEALLVRLKAKGVDHIFANGGTDFGPLIEGLSRGVACGMDMPQAVVVPHETAAVAMAHGHYLITRRPQAVMVHVNVGLANAVMGLLNAAADDVPIFMFSGRTPVTELGRPGSRDVPIHWGQEMRDQHAMVRECVKWDYELRYPEQVDALVDRALAIAMAQPRGPVYLSLPREVLAEPWRATGNGSRTAITIPSPPHPDPEIIARAAGLLAAAKRPLIVAQRGGGMGEAFEPLAGFARRHAIPMVEFWPTRNALGADHPMHAGYQPGAWLADADAVVVLDAPVPWIPKHHALPDDCPVIHIGPDPLLARTPVRGFATDIAITATVDAAIAALDAAMAPIAAGNEVELAARRRHIEERNRDRRKQDLASAHSGNGSPMSPQWVSHCLAQSIGPDAVVFSELGCDPAAMCFTRPGTYFAHALSAGLGWAMPAALGAQLAERQRLVVACVGDGSYMFANPVACHQVAEAMALPILTVVFNNSVWNAVRRATLALYPDGHSSRANLMPITSLAPTPDFVAVARASRAWAERVEHGDALPDAIERAITVIREERRQALLEVVVSA
jgi:acetolactate synthase-1/2/3 large subunit